MTTRTGHCWLCGAPSDPKGIGGEKERCVECKASAQKRRRKKWSEKNADREAEMKRAYANSDARKSLRREQWKRNPTRNKAWVAANRDKVREYAFKYHLMKHYGLTPEKYRAMFAAQKGRCGICKTDKPGARLFHVDHHHASNKVRALLCVNCNNLIGRAKEDTRILMAAIDYLVAHGAPGILSEAA